MLCKSIRFETYNWSLKVYFDFWVSNLKEDKIQIRILKNKVVIVCFSRNILVLRHETVVIMLWYQHASLNIPRGKLGVSGFEHLSLSVRALEIWRHCACQSSEWCHAARSLIKRYESVDIVDRERCELIFVLWLITDTPSQAQCLQMITCWHPSPDTDLIRRENISTQVWKVSSSGRCWQTQS